MRLIVATFLMLVFAFPASAGQQYPAFQKMLTDLCMQRGNFTRAECAAAVRRNMKPPLRNGYAWVPSAGGRPSVFIYFVDRMNKQGNTLVFGRHCNSACAIAWNLARKKCLLHGGQVGLAQHKYDGKNRELVDYRSRSVAYWKRITKGKDVTPSHEMVYWNGSAPKCPKGVTIAGYRRDNSRGFSGDDTPSIFRAPY